ncbi:Calcineurin-like phosphoesterase [Corynebacterium kalinowskii]|uniref:Calcineurin-like phosphoesterase n=1 Tax=Corynebacterium kalinowskii TaxID=2675216 RepID=A0A6B8W0L6_9CORY|nr:FN3 domain-containing metallophosphoesterase family protein [Corynebacterium kalinowskii]QGU01268.1 Calcineurin-like phosphoesterase [Corynebacterium kalinowskii]
MPPQVFRAILGVGATQSEATVSWRTMTLGPSYVQLSEVGSDNTIVFEGIKQNANTLLYRSMETNLTGLRPGATYNYRIGSPDHGWTDISQFTTSDGDGTWDFLALADPQIGVNLKNAEQGHTWRTSISAATNANPNAEMIISLGDQVDGWGAPQPQYNEFFSPNQLRSYPTAVIPGNHETYLAGMRHFDEHFSLPNESNRDYFYIRNNVLFIGLDSNQNRPEDVARHQAFVRDVVAKHGADVDWTIATYHHVPFSQGSHTNDADVVALREGWTPVLSEVGVDVVLSGHDHIYTRSHLMKGTSAVPQEGNRLQHTDGQTLYITTTTAGGGKYYDFHDVNGQAHPGANPDSIDPALQQPWTAFWSQDYTPGLLGCFREPTGAHPPDCRRSNGQAYRRRHPRQVRQKAGASLFEFSPVRMSESDRN